MNEGLPKLITEQNIVDFANRLEIAGYSNAIDLARTKLVPLARKENISLMEAAHRYANQNEDQDTSYFQLFHALQRFSRNP